MASLVLFIGLLFCAAGAALICSGKSPPVGWFTILFFGGCSLLAGWELVRDRMQSSLRGRIGITPAGCIRPLILRRSAAQFLIYSSAGAGLASGGVFMVVTDRSPITGWLTVVFFGLGSLLLLWQALDGRARL